MAKKIAILSLVSSVILVALYSAFWFIYADHAKTRIRNLYNENPGHIAMMDVEISGFPFQQKVKIYDLKFTIPNPALDQYQVNVKEVEAKADLFSSEFEITSLGQILIQDLNGNSVGYVELNHIPEIEISLEDHVVEEFYYSDTGYRILDENKVAIYIADASEILYEGDIDDNNKITAQVKVKVSGMQGFDIVHIYENLLEDIVIAKAKSGKITASGHQLKLAPTIDEIDTQVEDDAGDVVGQEVMDQEPEDIPESQQDNVQQVTAINEQDDVEEEEQEEALDDVEEEDLLVVKEREELLAKRKVLIDKLQSQKGDIEIELEYELIPNYSEVKDDKDPTAIHQQPSHFDRLIKIKKFEYNNAIYSIYANGRANIIEGDLLPSGAISIDINGIDELVGHLSIGFEHIIHQQKPQQEVASEELSNPDLLIEPQDVVDNVPEVPTDVIEQEAQDIAKTVVIESDAVIVESATHPQEVTLQQAQKTDDIEVVVDSETVEDITANSEVDQAEEKDSDPYIIFLNDLIENLPDLAQDIAAKNQLSEGQSAVFELRRQKNDEDILINERLMSEIFGKTQVDEDI